MIELLKKIDEEGIVVEVVEGELKLFSSKTSIDGDLLSDIKANKKELTAFLSRMNDSKLKEQAYFEIPQCPPSESYRLSNTQYGIWAASQIPENSIAYNISSQIMLDGDYDIPSFQKAIYAVIDRHEILRTVFRSNQDREVQQYILSIAELGFEIDRQDFSNAPDPEAAARAYVQSNLYRPFDLAQGPLIRASLLGLADNRQVFFFSMHHIISDAWSMQVLSRDVLTYYEARLRLAKL